MTHITDKAENIVAPATVPGSGAVGIIRLSGPDVITIADSILTLSSHTRGKRPTLKSTESYKMRFARISDIDEVLAVPFRAVYGLCRFYYRNTGYNVGYFFYQKENKRYYHE